MKLRRGRIGVMHKLVMAFVIVLLSGCGVDEWIDSVNADRFQKACVGFGFAPHTTAFANCMMQQSAQNEEENQRIQDRVALDNAAASLKKGK